MSLKASEKTIPNDPYGLSIYTLSNGLTLYLSRRTRKPRIEARIAVKAGSAQDPEKSTGAAHILEHLMFKGSSRIGAISPREEMQSLEYISGLFDQLRNAGSETRRKAVFAELDKANQAAAALALPGEYDRILSHLGARGVNAYTSLEETVYKCDIPSVELERWIMVERERFSSPVMRSFLTEIEAIYEELNQEQDDDFSRARELLLSRLFPDHPFGNHSILGLPEHIKAPSLKEIEAYRVRWYRPEHMAICLAGDIDLDYTVELFESHWGSWSPPAVAEAEKPKPARPVIKEKRVLMGPDSEFTMTGFRFGGILSKDYNLLYMLDLILNNSQAGLIDLNLVQKQRLLEAGSSLSSAGDYSWFVLYGTPGQGQSLGTVHRLLLKQLELIRKGDFDDRLLQGVMKYLEIERIQELESNELVDAFVECYTEGISWQDYLSRLDELRKIRKEDLVRFVKKNFNDGYIRIDKKEGEDAEVLKMEKPDLSPVIIEYNKESVYFQTLKANSPGPVTPEFPDYGKELNKTALSENVQLISNPNKNNELFELTFIFPEGKSSSSSLPVGGDYFPYIGTDTLKPEEIQKEAFFLGLELSFQVDLDRSIVSLYGKQDDLDRSLQFLRNLIVNGKGSSRTYRKYVQSLLKRRKDAKLSKRALLFGGLYSWGLYGADSPFRDILDERALKDLDPDKLMDEVRRLFRLPHTIYYFGSSHPSHVAELIRKTHPGSLHCTESPRPARVYKEKNAESLVYFTHHDMVQAELFRVAPVAPFSEKHLPSISLFNEFFGTGLNSLVFQEIREARGLAYTAYSSISVPEKAENRHVLHSFIGTQGDKLINAVEALDSLLHNIPSESRLFHEARSSLVKSQASERILDADIFWSWWESHELGLDPDFRRSVFRQIEEYSYSQMESFFRETILGARSNLLVLGNRDEIDRKALEKMGEFRELSPEDLFNY